MSSVTYIAPERRIRQKRSQVTYDALIETAFALLEDKEFDDVSIAELAQEAGYSVGAFYARFRSKDELFDAMVVRHLYNRRKVRREQFAALGDAELLHALLGETVHYYWGRRRFWRAAMIRSIRDPQFWVPIRALSHEFADSMIRRIAARAQRSLTRDEDANVRFAVQLAFGTINNTILNRPGPFLLDQEQFIENLVRAFRLVSGYDELVAKAPARGRKARKTR
ncbi:MAG TPA: helix-turn-helix domain-containing protein [Gammaproteobacteria bacterium]|nr:helix-turn-helix domain-containing protein [Gammaproteobacteria bacterium]